MYFVRFVDRNYNTLEKRYLPEVPKVGDTVLFKKPVRGIDLWETVKIRHNINNYIASKASGGSLALSQMSEYHTFTIVLEPLERVK